MSDQDLVVSINKALQEIRPLLAFHRGDIEFIEFKEGVVYVKLLGACHGCPLAQLTLKSGVEELLRARVKEVDRVEAI